jgi:hypothetical protein
MTTPINVAPIQPGEVIQVSVSSVGDRGPQGDVGPANTLAIGTVASGGAAAATITGTAPSQTLNLTLPAGPQGQPGPQGPQGTTGPAGPANTLTVGTVTTGAAGSSASAAVTGTAPSQTLNLTIPRGDTGATGEVGATGAQGPQGATGARGAPGKGNDTIWKIKATSQDVENDDELQDDADLQFSAAANSTYLVTMAWVSSESAAGRTRWSLGLPAGATISQALHQFAGPDEYRPEYHLPVAPNMPELVLPFDPELGKENDGLNTLIAVVKTAGTAGTVAFRFCQVSNVTAEVASIAAGSWLRAEVVAPDPAAPASQATGVNVAAPSANVTLTTSSKRYQFLAPSDAVDVTLPAISSGDEGLSFVIKNEDGTFTHTLRIKDSGNDTVALLESQYAAEIVCTGSGWKVISLGA